MPQNNVTIRDVCKDDHDAITQIVTDAFAQKDEADLVNRLRQENAITIERVAIIDGQVVGHIAFSEVTSEPATNGLMLGLAPLAVATKHQRDGIGRSLVEDGLRKAQNLKPNAIIVLGEPAYYSNFGFKPASQYGYSWAQMDAGDAFQVILAHNNDNKPHPLRKIHFHRAFDTVS